MTDKEKETKRVCILLSNMSETDGRNYDARADQYHKIGDYENVSYYREQAEDARLDSLIYLEFGNMI